MKRGPFSIYCGAFALGLAGMSASAWALTHVVKTGDVLSKIAGKYIAGPAWGKNGGLSKILDHNPQIKDPRVILPGEKIKIPLDENVFAEKDTTQILRAPALQSATTSVPTLAPSTPEPRVVEKNTFFKRGALLSLTPEYALSVLSIEDSATRTRSSLATKYHARARLAYVQEWSETSRSFVFVNLGMLAFEKPSESTKIITGENKFTSGMGLGGRFDLSSRFNLETEIAYGKELFGRPASTQSVTVDAVSIFALGSKLSYDFVRLDPFIFGVASSVYVKGPAKADSYDLSLGYQYSGIIYLKQSEGEERHANFQTELGFTSRRQNTSITRQTQTDLTLGLRFSFPVGRREAGGP